MSEHPHTIENGGGETLTFVGVKSDERGKYLEIRNVVKPGAGPPMHTHHLQEEAITVEQGTLAWQGSDGVVHTAGPGETVVFAPGEAHSFRNAGAEDLIGTGYVRPPDNLEYFLTEIFASMKRNGGERPEPFDAAYLSHRYRSEFGMPDIPAPVQRIVFPVVATVGGFLGKAKRFAGAPEPVRRSAG